MRFTVLKLSHGKRTTFILDALLENLFPCLVQLADVACIVWLVAPSITFKSTVQFLS